MELDHLISNEKGQGSVTELRGPLHHAAKSLQRERHLADDRIGKYRKIRIISPPHGLLTGENISSYSRLPNDHELYHMKEFTLHATRCSICAHPYETYHRGDTLCSKGRMRALIIALSFRTKAGQVSSLVDLKGNCRVQIEIPADYSAVRELFKAMEHDLRLLHKGATISYNKAHQIQPRISQLTLDVAIR